VQHAITNILRHADAHRLQVTVEFGVRKLSIRIHDDGRGFGSAHGLAAAGHFGLLGMRERAREIGGELRLRSAPNRGTTVSVLVPYPAE
jgi:signal transduction histidine kinase